MIPKVIHYCWFGKGKKNELFKKCYASWKKYCPDYKIIEWNEKNFDLKNAPKYVQEAYKMKKWAFVTDYVRLMIIYENGGIYLDTDVELLKPINHLLTYPAFFGFQTDDFVNTGLGFGSVSRSKLLEALIHDYQDISFVKLDGTLDTTDCPRRNHHVFAELGLVQNNERQFLSDGTLVFEASVLCPIDYRTDEMKVTDETLSIHWFSASWKAQRKLSTRIFIKLFGKDAYEKVRKRIRKK